MLRPDRWVGVEEIYLQIPRANSHKQIPEKIIYYNVRRGKMSKNFLGKETFLSITSFRSISSHKILFLDVKWRIKNYDPVRGNVEPVDSSILRFWHKCLTPSPGVLLALHGQPAECYVVLRSTWGGKLSIFIFTDCGVETS